MVNTIIAFCTKKTEIVSLREQWWILRRFVKFIGWAGAWCWRRSLRVRPFKKQPSVKHYWNKDLSAAYYVLSGIPLFSGIE